MLALGPLTNVAEAIALDPQFEANVAEVVAMGGAFVHGGNINPAAEANFWGDPEAADAVCALGPKVRLVGLDVTQQLVFTAAEIEGLRKANTAAATFVADVSRFYNDFHQVSSASICVGIQPACFCGSCATTVH